MLCPPCSCGRSSNAAAPATTAAQPPLQSLCALIADMPCTHHTPSAATPPPGRRAPARCAHCARTCAGLQGDVQAWGKAPSFWRAGGAWPLRRQRLPDALKLLVRGGSSWCNLTCNRPPCLWLAWVWGGKRRGARDSRRRWLPAPLCLLTWRPRGGCLLTMFAGVRHAL